MTSRDCLAAEHTQKTTQMINKEGETEIEIGGERRSNLNERADESC